MSDQNQKRDGFGIGEAGKVSASPIDDIEAAALQYRRPDYPNGRRLDCGCKVYYRSHVMNASLGTSCPDCYDRMEDY